MNLDKGIISHWANLFESEEAKANGTYIVCEELNDEIKNTDGTAVDESSYDDSALTFEDVQEKINQNKERFKNLFGVIDVYAKGRGNDWAIFVELANRKIRFDSQYGEPIDDDLDGEYADACRESVDTIKNEILGREAGNNFVSEFAFELDWDGERLVDKKYIDQASATVMKIVPKRNASQDNKRYFAEKSAELYKMAQKMQVDAGADRMTLRKRSYYIWNKYAELELQYGLWGHDERDFDEFLETVGGYGREELMAAIRGKHEGDVDESAKNNDSTTLNIRESEDGNGKEIIDTFTNILNYGLPKPELKKMLASLETLKGKEDMINQTELERLITMYKRELGGDVSEEEMVGEVMSPADIMAMWKKDHADDEKKAAEEKAKKDAEAQARGIKQITINSVGDDGTIKYTIVRNDGRTSEEEEKGIGTDDEEFKRTKRMLRTMSGKTPDDLDVFVAMLRRSFDSASKNPIQWYYHFDKGEVRSLDDDWFFRPREDYLGHTPDFVQSIYDGGGRVPGMI